MPYPTLVSARRAHYEIDGTVVGYNINGGVGSGLVNVLSSANKIHLNGESPSENTTVISLGQNNTCWIYFLFPEAVDLSYFLMRLGTSVGAKTLDSLESSANTTNGADGTWTSVTRTGTPLVGNVSTDWWRTNQSPATLTANNTNIIGLRLALSTHADVSGALNTIYLWGTKHSGATPDDIIFLSSTGPDVEWATDDDWGDLNAGTSAVTHTYYVKNTSGSLTANTITVKSSGSDSTRWTVSLDNSSFASSKSITSLAPGASQVVYFKFTPPSPASGVYRPYAAYLEADVTSWT